MSDWTPRGSSFAKHRAVAHCASCRDYREIDTLALIVAGHGDKPWRMIWRRLGCSRCKDADGRGRAPDSLIISSGQATIAAFGFENVEPYRNLQRPPYRRRSRLISSKLQART